ncbi:hypothetical protein F5883DRAFT_585052 [Diaporthe sp. PMI_573]|nr:hypothetical protein F5883DRAFT_585052 [Diaporthaceae sp. PMI_573]
MQKPAWNGMEWIWIHIMDPYVDFVLSELYGIPGFSLFYHLAVDSCPECITELVPLVDFHGCIFWTLREIRVALLHVRFMYLSEHDNYCRAFQLLNHHAPHLVHRCLF